MANFYHLYAILIWLTFSAVNAIQEPEQIHFPALGGDDEFIPFKTFLHQVQLTKYDDYKQTPVETEKDFYDMKKHILYMYRTVTNVDSSFILDGDYADCIAIKEQPGYQDLVGDGGIPESPKNSTFPEKGDGRPPGKSQYAGSPLKLGWKDKFGNPVFCPEGTIPMQRD